jgi:hypothetical protein
LARSRLDSLRFKARPAFPSAAACMVKVSVPTGH